MSFLIAFAIAVLLMPAARRLGVAAGVVDRPSRDELKIHQQSVPLLGGAAVVAAALTALAVTRAWLPGALVASTSLALAVGFVDDLRPLPVWPRIVFLAGAGAVLAAIVPLGPVPALGAAGIILLAVICANAVNLLDGQDGLAGGLGAIAALCLAAVGAVLGLPESVHVGLSLGGGLAGFLLWNRPPARIFLGNGGVYAAGILLAGQTALVTAHGGWRGLLAAGLCLSVFAFEVVATTIRRILTRDPVVQGDRLHSYDLVAARVGSRTASTLAFWGLGVLGGGLGLAVASAPLPAGALLTAAVGATAGVWGFQLWTSQPGESRAAP